LPEKDIEIGVDGTVLKELCVEGNGCTTAVSTHETGGSKQMRRFVFPAADSKERESLALL
jgi:hypothetical protein